MPSLLAGLLVFTTSAAVLVLEILAGRILAPYVGDTLQTYTGIIGTVLAGIAAGTWVGGKLADRHEPRSLLGPTIVLGGALSLLILPLIGFFGPAVAGRSVDAIVFLSLVGFFAPAAVLSAVTPTVIKLQLASLDETGRVVGRLSALGTVGAIVGTFVTGFVLIAAFPTGPTVLAVGLTLIVGGLLVWVGLGGPARVRRGAVAAGLVAAIALALAADVPCELESAYYCAQVVEDPDRETGRTLRLDALPHSYVDLADPTHLEFDYTVALDELVARHAGEEPEVLHLGGGGFTLPRRLARELPGSRNVVVEVDPALVDLAREELAFAPDDDGVEVVVADARTDVADRAGQAHDVVLGDAFGGLAVPWHLTTLEFLADLRAAMADDGIYALNMIDHVPLDFARAHAATLDAAFAHTVVLSEPDVLAGEAGGNIVLAAADRPIDAEGVVDGLAERGVSWGALAGDDLDAWVGEAMVLTDDHAPVDQLLTVQPPRSLR